MSHNKEHSNEEQTPEDAAAEKDNISENTSSENTSLENTTPQDTSSEKAPTQDDATDVEPTRVVGIGTSAGGLAALRRLLNNTPNDTGMAFVIIQHLSPAHNSELPQILQKSTAMPVTSIDQDRTPLQANHVYVISPDHSLCLEDGVLQLLESARSHGSRAVIDVFFRSLAKDMQRHAVGIILSGTGSDGTQGLGIIKEHGGITVVQDFQDAEFSDMPRNAMHANLVDLCERAEDIPRALLDLIQREGSLLFLQNPDSVAERDKRTLNSIFQVLFEQTGHDFSGYKQSTALRRLGRRMNVHGADDLRGYLKLLRGSAREQEALFREMLITVTEFFRDPETFTYVEHEVIPDLFARAPEDKPVRVWVVGCATGEEAYSLAILLHEHNRTLSSPRKVQVFASDINRDVLDIAREGVYPRAIAEDVTRERLKYFFDAQGDSYRVKSWLREMVLFSPHNLLSDPPFARLDMISCRNMLIYLQSNLQSQAFDTFHYALNDAGVLLLGNSENADRDLFEPHNKNHKVFVRNDDISLASRRTPPTTRYEPRKQQRQRTQNGDNQDDPTAHMQRLLLDHYMPPSVLVNADYDVVYVVGKIGRYLEPPHGVPNYNVLEMAQKGMRLGLRTALIRAFRQEQDTLNVLLPIDTATSLTELQPKALPSADADTPEADTVTSPDTVPDGTSDSAPDSTSADSTSASAPERIEPASSEHQNNAQHASATGPMVQVSVRRIDSDRAATKLALISFDGDIKPGLTSLTVDPSEASLLAELERELYNTRESLQSTLKEMETSNEELRASNEELQSLNEELQSTNEELTTSKEELQSTYEELTIVNKELEDKVEELEQLNNDLNNFMASTEVATVFVDEQRRLKRYTPQAANLLNIINADVGRPFAHISHTFQNTDLPAVIEEVLDDLQPLEREVQDQDERWFIMRARPYRTADNRIDGVVITWNDVTSIKREQAQLAALLNVFPDAIIRVDKNSKHLSVNPSSEVAGINQSLIGSVFEENVSKEHADMAYQQLRKAFETGEIVTQRYTDPLGIAQTLEARMIAIDENEAFQIVRNVTEQDRLERALRENKEQLEMVLEGGELAFWDWRLPEDIRIVNDRWANMFGYHIETIASKLHEGWFPPIHPDDAETRRLILERHLAGDEDIIANEFRMQHQQGHWLWVRERGKTVAHDETGKATRAVGVLIDISTEKAAAAAIQNALEEKELLLQELNHRVKNNLQMIASMLSIQSRQVNDTDMRDMLLANRARIQAISLVHKELYGENFDGYLQLDAALNTISKGIASLAEDATHHVEIDFSGVPLRFGIDRAIPLGLVVGEIVGNACKHAFPTWANIDIPQISIKLMETDNMIVLEVYDNGVGVDHPQQAQTPSSEDTSVSMGNQLIKGFMKQIDGTLTQDTPFPKASDGYVGTRFILHVPKQDSVKQ